MKSETIILKIEAEQKCSIADAERLTRALHRENKLDINKMIRFRPLFRDFDIINADFATTYKFNLDLCETIGTIQQLKERFIYNERI